MEVSEETDGSLLPELRRLAAASLAFLTSFSNLQSGTFCNCVIAEEDCFVTEVVDSFNEICGGEAQKFARLLAQAKAFQFYFALQEARQHVEQDQHTANNTAIPSTTTEVGGMTTRDAVAAAIEVFELRAAENASLRKEQGTTAADTSAADLIATADDVERTISTRWAASAIISTQKQGQNIALVSDTEVEMWKWEALSADSEAPTDTEGQDFTKRKGSVTTATETSEQQRPETEGGFVIVKQDQVTTAFSDLLRQRRERARGRQSDVLDAEADVKGMSESAANITAESELHMAQVKIDSLSSAAPTVGALEAVSVDEKRETAISGSSDSKVLERTEDHVEWETQRSSEGVEMVHAEAAERRPLFSLSAGGIRRRRGKRDENLKESRSILGKDSREPAVEKEEDVTGQLLGLAQEMKVEATRYGEVLQRDNERLQRTGEAQQQYMDDTEASARQTKSFIKGTGFGFLYTMILLIIACVLFVFMLSFIFLVRG